MALRPIATTYGRDEIVRYGLNVALDQAGQARDRIKESTRDRDEKLALTHYNAEIRGLGAAATPEQKRDVYFRASLDERIPQAVRQTYAGLALQSGGAGNAATSTADAFKALQGGATPTGGDTPAPAAVEPPPTTTQTVETKANGDKKVTNTLPLINNARTFDLGDTAASLEPGVGKASLNILDTANKVGTATIPGRATTLVKKAAQAAPAVIDATLNALGPDAQPTSFGGNPNLGVTSTGESLIPGQVNHEPVEQSTDTTDVINRIRAEQQLDAVSPQQVDEAIDYYNRTPQPEGADPLTAIMNILIPTAAADVVSPSTPVSRTQEALAQFDPTALIPRANPSIADFPAPPNRPQVGATTAVPSPLPVEPTVTGTPLAPPAVDPTQLVPRQSAYYEGGLEAPAIPLQQQTPQQLEILQNQDAGQTAVSNIQAFRQANNLPQNTPEADSRLSNFLTGLLGDARQAGSDFASSVQNTLKGGAPATQPVIPALSTVQDIPDVASPVRRFAGGLTDYGLNFADRLPAGVTYRGMTKPVQESLGVKADGDFGPNTAKAMLASGMDYEEVNDFTRQVLREQILAAGRYQYIPDTLSGLTEQYNAANPDDQLTDDTVFDATVQDKLINFQLDNINPNEIGTVIQNASGGNLASANATPETQRVAAVQLLYALAAQWGGLPNSRDTDNGRGETRLPTHSNAAQITLDDAYGYIQDFFESGDKSHLRTMIAEAETGTIDESGYGVANTPGYFRLTDNDGSGVDKRREYFNGDVSTLTLGDIYNRSKKT